MNATREVEVLADCTKVEYCGTIQPRPSTSQRRTQKSQKTLRLALVLPLKAAEQWTNPFVPLHSYLVLAEHLALQGQESLLFSALDLRGRSVEFCLGHCPLLHPWRTAVITLPLIILKNKLWTPVWWNKILPKKSPTKDLARSCRGRNSCTGTDEKEQLEDLPGLHGPPYCCLFSSHSAIGFEGR